MRRSLAALGLVLAVSGGTLSMVALPTAPTRAAADLGATFVIPANDGYGIADCVASGSTCGRVVADAWCEAQGYARSASFGPASLDGATPVATAQPISVTCAR